VIINQTVPVMLEHLKQARAWTETGGPFPCEDMQGNGPCEVLFHPKFWPGFLDKTDELRLQYEGFKPPYNVSRVEPNVEIVTEKGNERNQYIQTSCTMIDCRASLADANKAVQIIKTIYAERSEFDCQTYPPGISAFAEIASNAMGASLGGEMGPSVGLDGSVYWSAYTARLWPVSLLIMAAVGVATLNVVCYSGCLLLCCREWWCQNPKLKRFQYF